MYIFLRLFVFSLTSISIIGCSVKPAPSEMIRVDAELAALEKRISPRIADCISSLPAAIPGASPQQIRQACLDKYSLYGSFVGNCYQSALEIAKEESIPVPISSIESNVWRGYCADRQKFPSLKKQPF